MRNVIEQLRALKDPDRCDEFTEGDWGFVLQAAIDEPERLEGENKRLLNIVRAVGHQLGVPEHNPPELFVRAINELEAAAEAARQGEAK